jgi:hypothetical protein
MADKAESPLLVVQANAVLRLLENKGFDPRDFHWDIQRVEQGGPTVDRIVHTASGHFFTFGVTNPSRHAFSEDRLSIFQPGIDRGGVVGEKSVGWDTQFRIFLFWADALKSEVETVSLWDTLGSGAARELALATFPDRKLTKEQQAEVKVRVQTIRVYLRSNVDDRDTLRRIEAKLDDLEEATKRLGVKDFANAAVGALLMIAWEAALDPHKAQEMVNLFLGGLRSLLGG